MIDLSNISQQPKIQDDLLVDKINKDNIHVLIQSILGGEFDETPEEWRQRIEGYAAELERELYR